MKYLIVAVAFFVIASFVNAECDEKNKKAINECYKILSKSVNSGSAPASKEKCKHITEHQECLKSQGCSKILTVEEFKKTSGEKSDEKIFEALFIEHSYDYLCSHKFTATKEDEECALKISKKAQECGQPKDCKELEKYVACYKDLLIKECKNEEFAQVIADAQNYGFKQILPKCQ